MSQHRIFGSEADQPRPLAYVSMFRPNRRRRHGVFAVMLIGGALMIAASILVLATGASIGAPVH